MRGLGLLSDIDNEQHSEVLLPDICSIQRLFVSAVAAETLSASTVGAADAGSGADREEQTLVGSFTKLDLSPQSPSHQESLQPDNPGEVQLAGQRPLYLNRAWH